MVALPFPQSFLGRPAGLLQAKAPAPSGLDIAGLELALARHDPKAATRPSPPPPPSLSPRDTQGPRLSSLDPQNSSPLSLLNPPSVQLGLPLTLSEYVGVSGLNLAPFAPQGQGRVSGRGEAICTSQAEMVGGRRGKDAGGGGGGAQD